MTFIKKQNHGINRDSGKLQVYFYLKHFKLENKNCLLCRPFTDRFACQVAFVILQHLQKVLKVMCMKKPCLFPGPLKETFELYGSAH